MQNEVRSVVSCPPRLVCVIVCLWRQQINSFYELASTWVRPSRASQQASQPPLTRVSLQRRISPQRWDVLAAAGRLGSSEIGEIHDTPREKRDAFIQYLQTAAVGVCLFHQWNRYPFLPRLNVRGSLSPRRGDTETDARIAIELVCIFFCFSRPFCSPFF